MKKIVCFLMCFVLIFSLCACGGTNDETPSTNNDTSTPATDNNQETQNTTSDTTSDEKILTGTYKVPLQKIYVDTPDFNLIEEGYTRIFFESGKKYVTFTCLYDDACDNISDAHNKTIDKFMQNVVDHHHVNAIGALSDATVTVNGIEAYKYEGIVNAGTNPVYDAYIYGYSFVYNGFPCSIVGVVMDEAQPEAEKQQVKLIVDEMMKTVRNSK